MQQQTNNNHYILTCKPDILTGMGLLSNKFLSPLKIAAFLFALSAFPGQSYADKAFNYGDINDEDGQHVSSHINVNKVEKVSYQPEPSTSKQKVVVKAKTKKMSGSDLGERSNVGYGDLHREEE